MRLRTLIGLRWLAIIGQSAAIIIAIYALDIDLRLDLCLAAIGISATINIIATLVFPENNRLTERNAMLTLLFDLCQLAFLLYVTGGLSNPFAVLMLAPVIISATTLTLLTTALLGTIFLSLITLLIWFSIPLTTTSGIVIQQSQILIFGNWTALVIAALFLAGYARRITSENYSMSEALTATQLALGREHRLTSLGGVVAAAAHEMGTPLATIKLVAYELADELADHPELKKDAELISSQADRCRDILRDMGRIGKDDIHLQNAPIEAVIAEAAEPHMDRGKVVHIHADSNQPLIARHPEIIHGLRNLIQNAVDFATENVWINATWTDDIVKIHIGDDGDGYPPDLIGKIGDPFVRNRNEKRPGYEGMGLGLFIAKTLLERTGARLTFANGTDTASIPNLSLPTGAIVEVIWQRSTIETPPLGPLGENQLAVG